MFFDANGIAAVKPVSRAQKTQSRAAVTEQVPAASDAEMDGSGECDGRADPYKDHQRLYE